MSLVVRTIHLCAGIKERQVHVTKQSIIDLQGVPKKFCPVCLAAVEEPYIQLFQFLHSCIGQASILSLRPCLSPSEK